MVSPKLNPQSCWEFEGDIMVLHHPTTIATRYGGEMTVPYLMSLH